MGGDDSLKTRGSVTPKKRGEAKFFPEKRGGGKV
jgi:hypothetical protein